MSYINENILSKLSQDHTEEFQRETKEIPEKCSNAIRRNDRWKYTIILNALILKAQITFLRASFTKCPVVYYRKALTYKMAVFFAVSLE